MDLSIGFGPFELARIMFSFEMAVTFGSAELEQLRIIPNELDTMTRIDRT